MKKLITALILFLVVATIDIGVKANEPAHKLYPRAMEIVEFEHDTDTVVCVDAVGLEWAFYGIEDWDIGDLIIVMLDNNGTPNTMVDDIITDTIFSGYRIPDSYYN